MKHYQRFLLIYHIFIAVVYAFQADFAVPLLRVPVLLFIGDIWVNKFTKYYTIFIGLMVALVGLTNVVDGPAYILDIGFGLLTMYYGSQKE